MGDRAGGRGRAEAGKGEHFRLRSQRSREKAHRNEIEAKIIDERARKESASSCSAVCESDARNETAKPK
jgi:hypothetical protein